MTFQPLQKHLIPQTLWCQDLLGLWQGSQLERWLPNGVSLCHLTLVWVTSVARGRIVATQESKVKESWGWKWTEKWKWEYHFLQENFFWIISRDSSEYTWSSPVGPTSVVAGLSSLVLQLVLWSTGNLRFSKNQRYHREYVFIYSFFSSAYLPLFIFLW